jgi:membrane protein insertase Oxa1/YidC/SpoIIIJ
MTVVQFPQVDAITKQSLEIEQQAQVIARQAQEIRRKIANENKRLQKRIRAVSWETLTDKT